MNDIAHTLYNIVQYILGFGPTVMLPLVLFILALFFKVKPAKALRSSLTVGIGSVSYTHLDVYKRQPPTVCNGSIQLTDPPTRLPIY